jgi:hypothetical protein
MRWLLPLAIVCVGCGSMEYRGVSPSVRSIQEEPSASQVYVGADANFAIIDPAEARRTSRPAETRREPLDVWNAPIAWEPKGPSVSNPVESAGASAQPAFGGN